MMIYLLYYDQDTGSREEWNTFYTPVEAFSTPELRAERAEQLENMVDEDGEPYNYKFYMIEAEVK